MANFNDLFAAPPAAPTDAAAPALAPLGGFSDDEILALWTKIRRECIDTRQVFEKQWQRNLLYVLGRQWIKYHANGGGWKDKRMAPWVDPCVTNKCKETVQAIRAMLTSIQLGVTVRPNGSDPKNVAAASTADDLAPLLHDIHHMNSVLNEFDFWLLVTGNAFLHTFVDYDMKYGTTTDATLQCADCGTQEKTSVIGQGSNVCPGCKGSNLQPAMDATGQPIQTTAPKGQPTTIALSPLEFAFPNSYARFEDLPYGVRLRWRQKSYYENHPVLKALVPELGWEKAPSNQSLMLFKSMAQRNDLGVSTSYFTEGYNGSEEEGITEYEAWVKPCDTYPDGLVFRIAGEKGGKVIHLEDNEGLPGPLPYKDADGHALFTFSHAAYEHVGGRLLGSGPVDLIVQKQDQLNQHDSRISMIVDRMAMPGWMIPKGAATTQITGIPGLIFEWDAHAFGGTAKPERFAGMGPNPTLFKIREQICLDIEELVGMFDIMKGAKPTGVEAFSALQLLDERAKGRFTPVFQARGDAYASWFKQAIELEREFGPDERTKAVMSSARTWTFQNFKRASLQGSMAVIVQNGSQVPKTSLGQRAALEHAAQLGAVNMQDPDQQYEALKLMGLERMVPTLDINVQSALQKQQAFEDWVADPAQVQQALMQSAQEIQGFMVRQASVVPQPGMPPTPPPSPLAHTPLKWKKWYHPIIHRQEFLKWANGDTVRQLTQEQPQLEGLLDQHLVEIEQAIQQWAALQMQMMPPAPPRPGGAGMAAANSNQNAGQGSQDETPGMT